jgi:hypothetical protein
MGKVSFIYVFFFPTKNGCTTHVGVFWMLDSDDDTLNSGDRRGEQARGCWGGNETFWELGPDPEHHFSGT